MPTTLSSIAPVIQVVQPLCPNTNYMNKKHDRLPDDKSDAGIICLASLLAASDGGPAVNQWTTS